MSEPKLQKERVAPAPDTPEAGRRKPATEPLKLTAYRLRPLTMKMAPAPPDRDWMDWHYNGANRCLPLRVANQSGWFLLNDCDFEVMWTGKPHTDSLKINYSGGRESKFVRNIFGHGILTWHIPYLFRTPPGFNLLVRGPTNWPKDGVRALDAMVETDWAVATFTMNWKITRPLRKVRFHKDEPICMITPLRRGDAEAFQPEIRNIESNPELQEGHQQWAQARRQLIAEKKILAQEGKLGLNKGVVAPWQPHYFQGSAPGGQTAPQHQVSLQIRPFTEVEPPLQVHSGDPEEPAQPADAKCPATAWKRFIGRLRRGV